MPAKTKTKVKSKTNKSRVSRKARLNSKPRFNALTLTLIAVGLAVVGYFIIKSLAAAPRLSDAEVSGVYGITQGGDFSPATYDLDITGLSVRAYWDEIEPVKGQYNWSKFDNVLAKAKAKNKKVKFFVLYGVGVPRWTGAQFFRGSEDSQCDSANQDIPIPWDQNLLREEQTFIKDFAARYRDDPNVAFFTVTGPSAKWGELCLPNNTVKQPGYSQAAVMNAWKTVIDTWSTERGNKRLSFSISAAPNFYPTLADDVANYATSKFGKDAILQWNFLDMKFANGVRTASREWSNKSLIGWQFWGATTWTDRKTTDYEGSMRLAMDEGADLIEVYDDDLRLPRSDPDKPSLGEIAEQIDSEIKAKASPGPSTPSPSPNTPTPKPPTPSPNTPTPKPNTPTPTTPTSSPNTPTPTPTDGSVAVTNLKRWIGFDWVKGRYYIQLTWTNTSSPAQNYYLFAHDNKSNPVNSFVSKVDGNTTSVRYYGPQPRGLANDTTYTMTVLGVGANQTNSSVTTTATTQCFWVFCSIK